LEVTDNARKIQSSAPFRDGLVELQVAASQAVVEALPLRDGLKVLDLCAGGGGKTLAMAARARLALYAHDADPKRMADLPARAARAGAKLRLTEMPEAAGPFDLVLADVPCSGSGSWRRAPEGKWRLSPERLQQLVNIQAQIIDQASRLIGKGGVLAYATCSMLRCENDAQIDGFLSRNSAFAETSRHRFTPLSGGDGFFLAILRKTTWRCKAVRHFKQ
jgi:16S rRNA (cytosine967-C5)-methyltransferase